MTSDERKQVGVALAKLAMATTGAEIDEARMLVYLEQLDRDDAGSVLTAIEALMRTAKFFPTIGEIVEQVEGSATLRAAEAWAALNRRDPATEETMRLIGGWRDFGERLVAHTHFWERRFCELYPSVEAKLRMAQLNPPPSLADGLGMGTARVGGGLRRIGSEK